MSTIAVNAITDANDGNTTTINGVTPNSANVVGKNLIINGAMQIAQRGTSVACSSSNSTYTLDRFLARPNSSTNTTVAQVTDAPSGFEYSAKVTRDSGQTGTLTRFETAFETKDIIRTRGQRVTISFYAKAGSGFTPSALSVLLFEGNGTERARGITSYDSETTLINTPKTLTTSWQRFTHTTTAVIASDTTQLALQFLAAWSGTAPSNDEFYITGVQLEAGESATEFEHRPYGMELQLCQRYYWRQYVSGANVIYDRVYWNGAGNNALFNFPAPAGMRINAATVTCSPTTNGTGVTFTYHPHGNIIVYRISASGDNYLYAQDLSINAEL